MQTAVWLDMFWRRKKPADLFQLLDRVNLLGILIIAWIPEILLGITPHITAKLINLFLFQLEWTGITLFTLDLHYKAFFGDIFWFLFIRHT